MPFCRGTFIDNHDTYQLAIATASSKSLRDNGWTGLRPSGRGAVSATTTRPQREWQQGQPAARLSIAASQVLRAYALILTHPGTPCVFHWDYALRLQNLCCRCCLSCSVLLRVAHVLRLHASVRSGHPMSARSCWNFVRP